MRALRVLGVCSCLLLASASAAVLAQAGTSAHTSDTLSLINRLQPVVNVVVTHVGIDDAELEALLDMNTVQSLPT